MVRVILHKKTDNFLQVQLEFESECNGLVQTTIAYEEWVGWVSVIWQEFHLQFEQLLLNGGSYLQIEPSAVAEKIKKQFLSGEFVWFSFFFYYGSSSFFLPMNHKLLNNGHRKVFPDS